MKLNIDELIDAEGNIALAILRCQQCIDRRKNEGKESSRHSQALNDLKELPSNYKTPKQVKGLANFNRQQNARKFELLAPEIAKEKAIVDSWGVLNVAQVSQQNGEREGCWSLDYLINSFEGTIGGLSKEMHPEIRAIWNAACEK